MVVKLRYVELPACNIFNWLNPMNVTCWNACPSWIPTWWETDTVALREEFGRIWTREFDKITGHFTELEKSITQHGIQRPISVVSGQMRNVLLSEIVDSVQILPPGYNDVNQILYTHTFGGSRLTLAQKHNINIPCVVHDFADKFSDCTEVTALNFKEWFGDEYFFVNSTPFVRIKTHSHISNKSYKTFNNTTRLAQQTAINVAKAQTTG